MAIQFFDGFDDYGTSNQAAISSAFVVYSSGPNATIAGAFGGYAIGDSNGHNLDLGRPLITPVSTFIVGARFLYASGSVPFGFSFSDTSNNVIAQVALTLNGSASSLSATRNGTHAPSGAPGGTSLGSVSSLNIAANTWYELEVKLVVGTGTAGSIVVMLNGVQIMSLTGINTQGTAGSTIGYAGPYTYNINSSQSCYFDDLYGLDTTGSAPYNTFLTAVAGAMGPRVYTAPPTANDGVTWTPAAGSNYSEVNNLTFSGDSYYNYCTTPGDVDLFNFAALAGNATVLAVQTAFVARMDDSGTREVSSVLNSGGTNYYGATRVMTANYQKFVDLYNNDPATGAAWSSGKFTGTPSVHFGYDCIA